MGEGGPRTWLICLAFPGKLAEAGLEVNSQDTTSTYTECQYCRQQFNLLYHSTDPHFEFLLSHLCPFLYFLSQHINVENIIYLVF